MAIALCNFSVPLEEVNLLRPPERNKRFDAVHRSARSGNPTEKPGIS